MWMKKGVQKRCSPQRLAEVGKVEVAGAHAEQGTTQKDVLSYIGSIGAPGAPYLLAPPQYWARVPGRPDAHPAGGWVKVDS